MASSGHSGKQKTDMQTQYTALASTVSAALAIGQNTVAAAAARDQKDLQLAVTREQGSALS